MSTRTYSSLQQSAWTYALPGFLGSSFLSIGSLGIGWYPISANALRWPIVNFFQTQDLGIALARAFLVVGAALLIQAWLMVGLDAIKGRIENIRTLYLAFVSWCAPLLFAVPLFSRDVYSYFMQGQMQLQGHSPYTSGVAVVPGWFSSGVDPLWGNAPSPYGPLFLLIEKFVAQICGTSALTSVLWFRAISVVGVVILCIQVPKLAQRHGINPISAVWLGVLNPLVIFHFVAGAHNDALMLGLAFWGLNFALDKKFFMAALLVTLAIAVKPSAFVIVPFLALLVLASASRKYTWAQKFRHASGTESGELSNQSNYALNSRILAITVTTLGSIAILAVSYTHLTLPTNREV